MSRFHLAQVNIARMRTELHAPEMESFIARLNDLNELADRAPGFVWRQSGEANAYLQPYEDRRIIFNMSVWQSVEQLKAFVYGKDHTNLLRQRLSWFERPTEAHLVLWWVRQGECPSVPEGIQRLDHLRRFGPTPYAFDFRTPADPAAHLSLPHDRSMQASRGG